MPKQEGQKSKLLALLRIFEQQTDENHLLNVPQLVELLEAQGIRCERKSVYSDIEALGALGYDIKLRRGRGGGYFLASRTFDLAELKLLVDAVQASRVVSGTTSRRLIHKLEKLCSNYEGSQLQRQVYVEGRPKTDSKSLLYSIDALHEAINNGKMVEFLYRKADSREKEKRTVSPWQLAWENGCYYLIAFADEKGIRHYRVDKIKDLQLLQNRLVSAQERTVAGDNARFISLVAKLDAMSPLKVLSRGYAMAQREDGTLLRSVKQAAPNDTITVSVSDGKITATVLNAKETEHESAESDV